MKDMLGPLGPIVVIIKIIVIIIIIMINLSIQGTMKKIPGPLAPPFLRRPSRKITALSYSFTTWR